MQVEQMALLIPILGILIGGSIAVIAVVNSHRQKQQRVELRHRERLAAIEKGIELAHDPEPDGAVRRPSLLRSALVGIFVGVVLYFALDRVADEDVALFGLIPAAFGLANLITFFMERKKPG